MDSDPRWQLNDNAADTVDWPDSLDWITCGISDWLMSDPVLRRTGAGSGVVNFLKPDGEWDGLYPEICGYFLQFTACAAARATREDDAAFRGAASAVAIWLDKVGGPEAEPLTLYHRDMNESDWRNDCLFAFDLAIILRGLVVAEARWPGVVPGDTIDRYARTIRRIVAKGRLDSHRLRPGTSAALVPVKWSTTQGVLHVKAAAALAGTGRTQLASVAQATLADEARLFAQQGEQRMHELHPFLYSIEGWLTIWGQTQDPGALANAQRAFRMVLGQIDPVTGELPPVANDHSAVVRTDVIAQALRSGLVLEAAGQLTDETWDAWAVRRRALTAALLTRVSKEGGILFDQVGWHRNAWASMFAWQALSFLRDSQAGTLDPVLAASALI